MRSRMVGGRHDSRGSVQIVDPDASPSTFTLEPERWAIATHRVNVLIQGTGPFITATLAVLRTDLHDREFTWPDRPLAGNTASATLLVQDIGELSPHALDALGHLIADTHPRVQVIVTSSVDLYGLVERGQFPVDLYFRLNVVMLTDDRGALSDLAPSS